MGLLIENFSQIIVARTDGIGDVILTLPIISYLKKISPKVKIGFISSGYLFPILSKYKDIDFLIAKENLKGDEKWENTCIIFCFPEPILMKRLSKSAPIRIATGRRWHSWLYVTHKVFFSRKKSNLHEAQLNFLLLKPLNINYVPSLSEISNLYNFSLNFDEEETVVNKSMRNFKRYPLAVIHPHSKGHTVEWGFNNFIKLGEVLSGDYGYCVIFVGTRNEKEKNPLPENLKNSIIDLRGELLLEELFYLISNCDIFIGNSSGPLHIAAALNKKCVGFFPPIPHISSQRWGPLSSQKIIIEPPYLCGLCSEQKCICLTTFPYHKVIDLIIRNRWLLSN